MYLRILLNIAPMCTNNTSWRSKDYYLEAVFYPDLFKSSANSPQNLQVVGVFVPRALLGWVTADGELQDGSKWPDSGGHRHDLNFKFYPQIVHFSWGFSSCLSSPWN